MGIGVNLPVLALLGGGSSPLGGGGLEQGGGQEGGGSNDPRGFCGLCGHPPPSLPPVPTTPAQGGGTRPPWDLRDKLTHMGAGGEVGRAGEGWKAKELVLA